MIAVRGRDVSALSLRTQAVLAHDPPDFLRIHDYPAMAQLGGDTPVTVAPADLGDRLDLTDRRIFLFATRIGVEGGARQVHEIAPPPDRDAIGPVITDPGALFGDCPRF